MPTSTSSELVRALRSAAKAQGFDVCRVADARAPWDAAQGLRNYIAQEHHGTMSWMDSTMTRRAHPTAMWAGAKSAVVLGLNYGPRDNPLAALEHTSRGVISVYAQGQDYHVLIKKRLKQLARWLADETNEEVKVFVDTAPLMEKPLAARAGLGWQGKHTNLVSRDFGSWLFLGVVLSAAELPADRPTADHCGSCRSCLDICPTGAFPAPYQLDARKCISYLTIEHDGPIARDLRAKMGNHIFGCDDCLAVCPWNKYAQLGHEAALWPRPENAAPDLAALCALDEAGFAELFVGSPVKRAGYKKLVRNVLIAIGNSGNGELVAGARARLGDEYPMIRGAAIWALSRLLPAKDFAALAKTHIPDEPDQTVKDEWAAGMERP